MRVAATRHSPSGEVRHSPVAVQLPSPDSKSSLSRTSGSGVKKSHASAMPLLLQSGWHSSGTPFSSQSVLVPLVMSHASGTPLPLQSVTLVASHSSGMPFALQSGNPPVVMSQSSGTPFSLQSGSHSSGMPLPLQSLLSPPAGPRCGCRRSASPPSG